MHGIKVLAPVFDLFMSLAHEKNLPVLTSKYVQMFPEAQLVESNMGSVGWANILAGIRGEGLGWFQRLLLSVKGTCPLLGV